jgi:flagellin-specific chaperone FliS
MGMQDQKIFRSGNLRDGRRAAPAQLIGMAYDLAVLACERADADRSIKTVLLLRDAMHSVGPEDSADLLQFYNWCLERIREGDFPVAAQTLSALRDAWKKLE